MYCEKCGTKNDENSLKCKNCGAIFSRKYRGKILLLILSIILLTVLLIPFGISKYTDTILEDKKVVLRDMGIDFNVYSTSGYIATSRKVIVKVDNGRYLVNNIYKILKNKMPEYKMTLETLFYDKGIDWEAILTGMKLKGELVTNNFLMKKPILKLSLKELSNEIMNEIKSDRKLSKFILPFLDNNVLSCEITFNLKGDKIVSFRLKDIDETILEKRARINFQLFNPIYENKSISEDMYRFSRLYTSIKNRNELINIQIDNLKFFQDKYSDINFKSKLNIENILFLVNDRKNFKFTTNDIFIKDSIEPRNKEINIEHRISTKNLKILIDDKKISLKDFLLQFSINHLKKKSLANIINDYNVNDYDPDDIDISNIITLINYGMNLEFNTKIKSLVIDKIKAKDIQLSGNVKLSKNTFSEEDKNVDNIINNLDVFAELKIDEKTAQQLIKLDEAFKTYLELSIKENGYRYFQLTIKNGEIKINNIDLSLWAEVAGDIDFNKKNYYQAIKFYKYSAEHGNNNANFRLAYSYGEIGKHKKAIEIYKIYIKNEKDKKAASVAMNNLAYIYSSKFKNYKKAIIWAKKAIKNGYDFPYELMGYYYEKLKDYKGAIKWFKKALNKSCKSCYFDIAYCYDELKDYKNAEKWYKKDMKQNPKNKASLWNLGLIYEYGKGKVQMNKQKAFELYLKAARLGYKNAMEKVAYMYRYGEGTNIDYDKAEYWENKAK